MVNEVEKVGRESKPLISSQSQSQSQSQGQGQGQGLGLGYLAALCKG